MTSRTELKTYEDTRISHDKDRAECVPEIWQWKADFGNGRQYRAVLVAKEHALGVVNPREVQPVRPVFVVEVRGDDDALGNPSWQRVTDTSGFAMTLYAIWSLRGKS